LSALEVDSQARDSFPVSWIAKETKLTDGQNQDRRTTVSAPHGLVTGPKPIYNP